MHRNFKNRDQATAFLRKNGVTKVDYDKYLAKAPEGTAHQVRIDAEGKPQLWTTPTPKKKATKEKVVKEETLGDIFEAAGKADRANAAKKKAATEKPVKEKAPKEPRVTVSSVARDLILAGKDNKEVFAELKAQFNIADDKKWYPAWYRSDLRRKGKLDSK